MRRQGYVVLAFVLSALICFFMPRATFALEGAMSDDSAPTLSSEEGIDEQLAESHDGFASGQDRSVVESIPSDDSNEVGQEVDPAILDEADDSDDISDADEDSSSLDDSSVDLEPDGLNDVDSEDVSKAEVESLAAQADTSQKLLSYATHVQNYGWQAPKYDGAMSGTSGKSLRLESLRLSVVGTNLPEGGIEYRAQVQNKGWLSWVKDGADCGTTGSSLRMEAIQVRLYGQVADEYDVYYRVHVQNYGWLSWAMNGELAGSTGKSLRLEGIQVMLVKKGEQAPEENPVSTSFKAFIDGSNLSVSAHVQNRGWMRSVGSGKVAGTTGRALRVEALRVSLAGARVPGGIEGRAHVQNIGWQRWGKDGSIVGTTGRSLRVEAVRFRLTGEAADEWDLYYRAHVQNVGWLSWAKNGEVAGTEGVSARIEAVEFVLCEKGAAGPQEEFHFDGPFPLSGDEVVDSIVWRKVIENGWSGVSGLRSAFQYVCSFPYKSMSNWPGPDSERWSVTFAKEMLVNGGGNCHRYASLMRWFAKALGYEARAVPGKLGGVNGSDHGWLEIDVDGTTYVIDPAVRNAYPEYNWFLVRYEDAKLKYYDLDGVRILK